MKKVTSRPDFQDREVPSSLAKLPRFAFTPSRANSREQSARRDVAFGIRTPDDLFGALNDGFADPVSEAPRPRPKKK